MHGDVKLHLLHKDSLISTRPGNPGNFCGPVSAYTFSVQAIHSLVMPSYSLQITPPELVMLQNAVEVTPKTGTLDTVQWVAQLEDMDSFLVWSYKCSHNAKLIFQTLHLVPYALRPMHSASHTASFLVVI